MEDVEESIIDISGSAHRPLKPIDFQLKIGGHVHRSDTLLETIKTEPYYWPIQFFLNGNTKAAVSAKEEDMVKTQAYLEKNPRGVFIHAPYCLNFCKPPGTEGDYFTKCAKDALNIASRSGFQGVVIHTGKCVKGSNNTLEHMKTNVIAALESATTYCPLLIETPAKQGTEQLTSPEELATFVADIDDPRLGICLDTCHVFSAGYDPMEYWKTLIQLECIHYVKLIHYNDSAVKKGGCRDRHARIGSGHIPLVSLLELAAHAINLGIPLVRE